MVLLNSYLEILDDWEGVFAQERTHCRSVRNAVSSLCAMGRRTISRAISVAGRDQQDWSADYRLFSRSQWLEDKLFQPVIERSMPFTDDRFIAVAFDDTKLSKTGRKIKSAFWQRDPMSPPFQVNLMFGLRFLQASILLPLYQSTNSSARGLPIRFTEVPAVKKPGKKATEEQRKEYKQAIKKQNLSQSFIKSLAGVRESLDEGGAMEKELLAVVDGSFCNRVCMSSSVPRTTMIARARKDARLCFKAPEGSKKYYGENKFTPEQIRQNEEYAWSTTKIFHGGQWREVRFKEVQNVLWQRGTQRKNLRLLVVAPTPYRLTKNKRLYYRDPAYLLCTETEATATEILQAYFDRWQIEVNHREEKDTLGIGQAQVRSEKSVPRQPAFVVAAYSALLLAGLTTYGPKRTNDYLPLPKWRRNAKRPSCLDLVTLLRNQMAQQGPKIQDLGIKTSSKKMVEAAAA